MANQREKQRKEKKKVMSSQAAATRVTRQSVTRTVPPTQVSADTGRVSTNSDGIRPRPRPRPRKTTTEDQASALPPQASRSNSVVQSTVALSAQVRSGGASDMDAAALLLALSAEAAPDTRAMPTGARSPIQGQSVVGKRKGSDDEEEDELEEEDEEHFEAVPDVTEVSPSRGRNYNSTCNKVNDVSSNAESDSDDEQDSDSDKTDSLGSDENTDELGMFVPCQYYLQID